MVYKAIKVTKEIMEPHRYCDVCGEEIEIHLACCKTNCVYCGKDLCENCIAHQEKLWSDTRIVYCKKCWALGEGFRPEIGNLQNKIESLYQEWQDNCKE